MGRAVSPNRESLAEKPKAFVHLVFIYIFKNLFINDLHYQIKNWHAASNRLGEYQQRPTP